MLLEPAAVELESYIRWRCAYLLTDGFDIRKFDPLGLVRKLLEVQRRSAIMVPLMNSTFIVSVYLPGKSRPLPTMTKGIMRTGSC